MSCRIRTLDFWVKRTRCALADGLTRVVGILVRGERVLNCLIDSFFNCGSKSASRLVDFVDIVVLVGISRSVHDQFDRCVAP